MALPIEIMLKSGTTVWHEGFGYGTVIRPYLPDKVMIDFENHGQKLLVAKAVSTQFPTIHIEREGADRAWLKPVPRWMM